MSKDPQTERKTPTPTHFRVILHASARPGLVACGGYAVGREHQVPALEADRLVKHKGFVFATPGDKAAHATAMAEIAAAAAKKEG